MVQTLKTAFRVCRKVTLSMVEMLDEPNEENILELRTAITNFFSCYPESDVDWYSHVWSGKFFPILAYAALHKLPTPDWDTIFADEFDVNCANLMVSDIQLV